MSIQADTIGLDVVLSAALPVALLLPRIVDALARHGDFDAGQTAVRWQLTAPGETVLDASKTLDELEIRDGTTLALSRSSMTFSAPRCDDEAEAISEAVTLVQRRWTRRTALIVGALIANCWAGVSAAGLLRVAFDAGGERRTGCVGIALAISLLALLAAAVVYRLYRERGAGLALGLLATGFAALAGLCAVSGGPGAPNAVFAAAAATTSSAIMRVIACHAVVFTTLTCITTTCGIATAVWMVCLLYTSIQLGVSGIS